ncbi:hypothetical protein J2Z83_002694 [Virgibacillus natechei]|uniref:Uncharacterized protein n=1 Tax=Virgibacillus natechei TaxID=1216297 RepID=A0ABS4IHZ4_9BACI|nr:hypothetical protein [Virgibacillus natechei]
MERKKIVDHLSREVEYSYPAEPVIAFIQKIKCSRLK